MLAAVAAVAMNGNAPSASAPPSGGRASATFAPTFVGHLDVTVQPSVHFGIAPTNAAVVGGMGSVVGADNRQLERVDLLDLFHEPHL